VNVSGFTTLYAFPNRFVVEKIPDLTKREIIPRLKASIEGMTVRRVKASSPGCEECDHFSMTRNSADFRNPFLQFLTYKIGREKRPQLIDLKPLRPVPGFLRIILKDS